MIQVHRPSFQLNPRSIKKLISFQFYYVLLFSLLIEYFKLPTTITYITDIVNLIILVYLLYYKRKSEAIVALNMGVTITCIFILFTVTLFTAAMNMVKPTLVIWSARNYLRFFPYFISTVVFEDQAGLDRKFHFLLNLQKLNLVLTLYQFFVMNLSADYLGGIFGTAKGCNGYTNIFLCIITIYSLFAYSDAKKIRMIDLVVTLISCLVVAAMAELKVFFLELVVIFLLYFLLSRGSLRKVVVIVSSVLAVYIGLMIFSAVFPQSMQFLTNIEGIMEYGTGTGGGYSLGRIGAYGNINRLIFHNDLMLNLFGLGFGNCEYSSFPMFTSAFYNSYGYLKYRWFTNQIWFLQCGYLGIIAYLAVIVSIFIWNIRNISIKGTNQNLFCNLSIVFSVILFIMFFYNQTCSIEISYVAFYVLASSFVACRSANKK